MSEAYAANTEPTGDQTCVEVRGFHDGDTFTCVTETGPLRVRVAGIDAPEVGQGYWRVSRDLLRSSTTTGSRVSCYTRLTDSSGRSAGCSRPMARTRRWAWSKRALLGIPSSTGKSSPSQNKWPTRQRRSGRGEGAKAYGNSLPPRRHGTAEPENVNELRAIEGCRESFVEI